MSMFDTFTAGLPSLMLQIKRMDVVLKGADGRIVRLSAHKRVKHPRLTFVRDCSIDLVAGMPSLSESKCD